MGRMTFNIIPRDGKYNEFLGDAAGYERSDIGRYELYVTDYATDLCEGETQTARRAWCADSSAILDMFVEERYFGLAKSSTLGEIEKAMSKHIADLNEFFEICDCLSIKYETLPILIERHDL